MVLGYPPDGVHYPSCGRNIDVESCFLIVGRAYGFTGEPSQVYQWLMKFLPTPRTMVHAPILHNRVCQLEVLVHGVNGGFSIQSYLSRTFVSSQGDVREHLRPITVLPIRG